MDDFFSSISFEFVVTLVFIFNFFLVFILILINLGTRRRLKRLTVKYDKFMNGISEGANIEELLEQCVDKLNNVALKNKSIENSINDIERNMMQCIQKIGVVRYNAFDNVGSDLSYSVALLDNNDSGVIFSGIFSRDNSLSYAKPVIGGKSKYSLSAEEMQALDIAKKSYRERIYTD